MSSIARTLVSLAACAALGSLLALPGCAPGDESDMQELQGANEPVDANNDALTGTHPVGTKLTATTNVNLRTGASTSNSIIRVIPDGATVTLVASAPTNGFYKVNHNGTVGWSFGQYYTAAAGGGGTPAPTGGRADAIARAKDAMGFSYWWGHGRFLSTGATASNKGSCSGSCPSCSHSGSYGGDCSGLVGKVWEVSGANAGLSVDQHPYSTASFVGTNSQWRTVSRGAVKPADAMVYNTNGAGHIFVYSSGDGWNSMYAYECKGCSYGCVYNLRTASSAYKAIARTGY
jgi:hypothetical protein